MNQHHPEILSDDRTDVTHATQATSAVDRLLAEPDLGGESVELEAGAAVHEPTDSAANLYFVRSGQVRIYQVGPDESARLVEILGPGDWFGAAALARATTYDTRAVAVSPTTVWQVPAEQLLALLSRQPELATAFIAQLADKLQQAREDAACLVFDDCNRRLIKTLLHFSRSAAATRREDGVCLRITHQQLAQAVGAARETISLALTTLRHKKLLRTGRNQLFFNPETLAKLAGHNGNGQVLAEAAQTEQRVA